MAVTLHFIRQRYMPFEFCRRRSMYHGRHVMGFVILSTGFRLSVRNNWEEGCEDEYRN